MPAEQIKKDIHWVGVVDWNLRNFHGYSVARRGTTYNAFLAMDEKVTLFDTVSKPYLDDFLHQIRKVIDPQKIDYLVVNHAEPDHSGSLQEIVDIIQPEKIFCSQMGMKSIPGYYRTEGWPLEPVKDGQTISIGKRSVTFLETRMLHWPDSMVSYLPEEKLLISSDAFGQNLASSKRFDDQVDHTILFNEAGHYFANIILPFSPLVIKVLDKIGEAGIEIDMIAPDHGMVWRSHAAEILSAYRTWAEQKPRDKAVVVYDTMWHSTEKMAKAITEGLVSQGIETRLMHLKACHHSDVMGELLDAGAVFVGSPTHNNSVLPLVADLLTYMKGLRPQNKIGAAFGSYGWSGESVKDITGYLEQMKMDVMEGVRFQYAPDHDHLAKGVELGRTVGQKLKERTGS
ncbi:MAG: FprA family A-type flavoprotein [Desulfovibrionales bacterium]